MVAILIFHEAKKHQLSIFILKFYSDSMPTVKTLPSHSSRNKQLNMATCMYILNNYSYYHTPVTLTVCMTMHGTCSNRFLLLYTKDLNALTEHDLIEFTVFLSWVPLAGSTIRTYVSGVQHHLKIFTLNDFQTSFLITLVLRGTTMPECQQDVRIQITTSILQKMFDCALHVTTSPYVATMIQSLLTLGFFGLFHPGEITWSPQVIKIQDIKVTPTQLLLSCVLPSATSHWHQSRQCYTLTPSPSAQSRHSCST